MTYAHREVRIVYSPNLRIKEAIGWPFMAVQGVISYPSSMLDGEWCRSDEDLMQR